VVGDIGLWLFDANGEVLLPKEDNLLAVSPAELRACPLVIAVASGGLKARAILAALRGGYVDILITDEHAARLVLEAAA
jgi:lsr operon transcriptional repressor